ncbi:MAG: hypothetical protein IKL52_04365 [Candidatus Gastranaerophilales bacterium]|jgi:hypothetical protein|nr:hypothetical protein [Candidatus Gastranaerophilales bacterium]
MQKFFQKKKSLEEIYKEARVKEYINKYIKELQRHFDMPDKKMRTILYSVYKDLSPINLIKTWIYMIKSKYIKELKGKLNED